MNLHRALAVVAAVGFTCTAAQPQCAARVPALHSLSNEFSPEELAFLAQILPTPTSNDPHVVRAELRAPLHISCQMKAFPHIQAFQEQGFASEIQQLKIAAVAQPPHLLLFDASDRIVKTVPIAPAWSAFQLRDLVIESIAPQHG